MKNGLHLFEHLLQRDLISNEKVDDLKNLLEKMRPKRRDLVRLVNEYQGLAPDDASSAIATLSRCSSPIALEDSKVVCCTIDCPCMKCVCYEMPSLPSCYLISTVLVLFALVAVCVLWYEDVPHATKYLNADEGRKKAGKYTVILLSLTFCGIAVRYAWKSFKGKWRGLFKLFIRSNSCIGSPPVKLNDVVIGIETSEAEHLPPIEPESRENLVLGFNDDISTDLIPESKA